MILGSGVNECRSVRVFHVGSLVAPLGLGGQVAQAGGPAAPVDIARHAISQGPSVCAEIVVNWRNLPGDNAELPLRDSSRGGCADDQRHS